MHYMVSVYRHGEATYIHDTLLPGTIPPRVLDLLVANTVHDDMGICDGCPLARHCHVLEEIAPDQYRLLCTVLFHDLVKPAWKIKDLT